MKYASLFSIELVHSFFTNERPSGLRLTPSPECLRLLVGCGMQWREGPAAGRVLTPLDETTDQPLRPPENGEVLRFYLQASDPNLPGITAWEPVVDWVQILKGEVFLRYQNIGDEQLTPSLYHFRQTGGFQVKNPGERERFQLAGRPVPDLETKDIALAGLNAGQEILDYLPSERAVWIETAGFAPGRIFTLTYRAIPTWTGQAFGLVDIEMRSPLIIGRRYRLPLAARKAQWNYYLATDLPPGELDIVDTDTSPEKIEFQKTSIPPDDPVGGMLRQKFPEPANLLLFRSDRTILFRESMSKNLQLIKTKNGGKAVLRDHLPVPSRDQTEVQMITYFS